MRRHRTRRRRSLAGFRLSSAWSSPRAQAVVSALYPVETAISTAYFPREEVPQGAELFELKPGMLPSDEELRRAAGSGRRTLSEADAARMIEAFKARLPEGFPLPQAGAGAARWLDRFAWERDGDRVILRHYARSGEVIDVAFADARAFTELQRWWVNFVVTLVCGFAAVIGIAAGATLAERLVKFFVKNPAVITLVSTVIDIGVAVTPTTIYNALVELFRRASCCR